MIVCVMGVSGAGKTVVGRLLASALGAAYLEGDDLHPPENVERMAKGIPLTDDDRRGWLAAIAARITDAKRGGKSLVAACSALKRSYRDMLRAAAPAIQFVHLAGDRTLIAQRLVQRVGHYMPATLLESQLATLQAPDPDEHAWTFDVAGTPESIVQQIVQRLTVRQA